MVYVGGVRALNLGELLLFERDLSVVADLPQRGAERPLVGGDAQRGQVLHALRGDPRDAVHALCTGKI